MQELLKGSNRSEYQYNLVSETILAELADLLGGKYVWTDVDKVQAYSHDEVTGEKYTKRPEVVVLPENAEQVAAIVKIANRHGFPIVPRGAGTGYAGGAVPFSGGIVVSLERMNRILEIDEPNMIMVVEPGVLTSEVQKAANDMGYR